MGGLLNRDSGCVLDLLHGETRANVRKVGGLDQPFIEMVVPRLVVLVGALDDGDGGKKPLVSSSHFEFEGEQIGVGTVLCRGGRDPAVLCCYDGFLVLAY